MNFFTMRQLPALRPGVYAIPGALGIVGTDSRLAPSASPRAHLYRMDSEVICRGLCDEDGPPFIWDSERRFQLRSEIDAAFFHLYGVSRDDADYILDTFPVLARSEERTHGEYRTKRVVLETYDALAAAAAKGIPYESPLGPPRRAT